LNAKAAIARYFVTTEKQEERKEDEEGDEDEGVKGIQDSRFQNQKSKVKNQKSSWQAD
jgi:hypothetical protein